jgi:hypothetical protein
MDDFSEKYLPKRDGHDETKKRKQNRKAPLASLERLNEVTTEALGELAYILDWRGHFAIPPQVLGQLQEVMAILQHPEIPYQPTTKASEKTKSRLYCDEILPVEPLQETPLGVWVTPDINLNADLDSQGEILNREQQPVDNENLGEDWFSGDNSFHTDPFRFYTNQYNQSLQETESLEECAQSVQASNIQSKKNR